MRKCCICSRNLYKYPYKDILVCGINLLCCFNCDKEFEKKLQEYIQKRIKYSKLINEDKNYIKKLEDNYKC